jgi:hypothetical protein
VSRKWRERASRGDVGKQLDSLHSRLPVVCKLLDAMPNLPQPGITTTLVIYAARGQARVSPE